jgi:FKBP-type peptidyl-prolyl cis-trans isomerase SlyD
MELKLETENQPNVIIDNVVVTLDYELTIDGEIVDSSKDAEPIIFLQGAGQVIPGLEKALYGMKQGEERLITVDPVDGYGEFDEEAIVDVPRDEFPADFPLEVGVEITVHSEEAEDDDDEIEEGEDDLMEATIVAIKDDSVTLDFNHPLAGKVLTFQIKVVELREATVEEIEHGHVHGDDSDFYFDDEDFEDEGEETDNHHH